MSDALPRAWLDQLRQRLQRPPERPRIELRWNGLAIGSVEPGVVALVQAQRPAWRSVLRVLEPGGAAPVAELQAEPLTPLLGELALALRELGLAHVWRDEQLAVVAPDGQALGTVERAVVRPLGIATRAVHLVGWSPDGACWVQQRAFSKANDPGLWDTLMGGMVPGGQTVEEALARETWEEAGLRLAQLDQLAYGGHVMRRSPTGDGAAGYVIERIDWYRCVVPTDVVPTNQDGEVERFEPLVTADLRDRLLADAFTPEAAAILASAVFGSCVNAC